MLNMNSEKGKVGAAILVRAQHNAVPVLELRALLVLALAFEADSAGRFGEFRENLGFLGFLKCFCQAFHMKWSEVDWSRQPEQGDGREGRLFTSGVTCCPWLVGKGLRVWMQASLASQ